MNESGPEVDTAREMNYDSVWSSAMHGMLRDIDPADFQSSQSLDLCSDNIGSPDSLSNIDTEDLFKPEVDSGTVESLNIPACVAVSDSSWFGGAAYAAPDRACATPCDIKTDALLTDRVNNFPGKCYFDIGFEPQKKLTKSTAWTYSEKLDKLFVVIERVCPVRIRSTGAPSGSIVRCTPMYSQSQYRQEVVRRCPNHALRNEQDNSSAPTEHFLHCDHKCATYQCDSVTEKLSVCIPYLQPPGDSAWSTVLLKMMCFTSCVGGINRRPIELVFTLESSGGEVLGQRAVEVRVCACPGRDRLCEEEQNPSSISSVPMNKTYRYKPKQDSSETVLSTNDSDVYTLQVKGQKNFKMLKRLNEALELKDSMDNVSGQKADKAYASHGPVKFKDVPSKPVKTKHVVHQVQSIKRTKYSPLTVFPKEEIEDKR